MGTLEDLLDDGWRYHDRESERLAVELEAVTAVPPERLAAFVHLAVHTIGEHLGDWPRAYALGRQILHRHEPDGAAASAWERLYVAATLSADGIGAATAELSALTVADDPLASLLAMRLHLVDALVSADRITEAGQIYRPALDVADRTAPAPALDRTMAIVGNNLAWALHDLPARSPDEDGAMSRAADASLTAWRRCGSWINEELALYLGARVALARGDAASALDLAGAGLRVIAANEPRPFDAARFHLLRAAVLTALADPAGRAEALSDADAAARHIAFDHLQAHYATERAQLDRPA